MAVFRINKTKNYTVMSNFHLKDRGLSLKAKGLLSLMLSLPDDWDYSISGLCAICIENESAVKSTLNELKKRGYLQVKKLMPNQTATGRIEYEYNIFEQPQTNQAVENLPLENQPLEIQGVENQGQLNTDESNTKEQRTKEQRTKEANTKDKKESKKVISFDALIDGYTENAELREALRGYVQMRVSKKAKPTNRALELVFKELDKLGRTDAEKIAIVNQSIMRNWTGVFPLKDNGGYAQQPTRSAGKYSNYEGCKII